jgi:hypothetical protein
MTSHAKKMTSDDPRVALLKSEVLDVFEGVSNTVAVFILAMCIGDIAMDARDDESLRVRVVLNDEPPMLDGHVMRGGRPQ